MYHDRGIQTGGNLTAWVILFILVIVTFMLLLYVLGSTMEQVEWRKETYIVKSGDTLWGIADEYCPESVDKREWIAEVKQINGLEDSIIRKGQRLTVLVPVE